MGFRRNLLQQHLKLLSFSNEAKDHQYRPCNIYVSKIEFILKELCQVSRKFNWNMRISCNACHLGVHDWKSWFKWYPWNAIPTAL